MKKMKFVFSTVVFAASFLANVFAADTTSTSWISPETLSSVVKLGSVLEYYFVEGLPEKYEYKEVNGKPDFGSGKLVRVETKFTHVGSGVLITDSGLIISNAHVTLAYYEPEVHEYSPNGKRAIGASGLPLSVVIKDKYPKHMFVGVVDKKAVENGDVKQHLKYVAKSLFQDYDYDDMEHDRAVLKIEYEVGPFNSEDVPTIGKKITDGKFSFSKLGNPFKYDYIEKDVRAVGFPGVGDPNRAAVTQGTMMGYEDEDRSIILHTSFISGGNSGGGLFYKNALVGINTWDYKKDASRPVAMAQPVSYWNRVFTEMKWICPDVALPEFSDSWLTDDPSENEEKDQTTVYISLMQSKSTKTPMEEGYVVAMNTKMTGEMFWDYYNNIPTFRKLAKVAYLARIESNEEMSKKFPEFSIEDFDFFRSIKKFAEVKPRLRKDLQPFFDMWISPEFTFSMSDVVFDGKILLTVPRNAEMDLYYMPPNEAFIRYKGVLTTGMSYSQGPYYLYVE